MNDRDISFLNDLQRIVQDRHEQPQDSSYTSELFAAGHKRIAQKVGEEGVELALAATTGDRDEVIDEAADLLYHMIVLLTDQKLELADVCERLRNRHQNS